MQPLTGARPGPSESGQEAVLDAAAAVFARRGYDRASIDDIADELGSTKGRVYHYWRSKEAVLAAVLHRGLQRSAENVQPVADNFSLAPFDRLHAMIRAHIATVIEDYPYQRVLLAAIDIYTSGRASSDSVAQNGQTINELRRRYEDLFVAVVDEGQRSGAIAGTDPRTTARALLGPINWFVVWFRPESDAASTAQIREELVGFCLRGLRP